MKKVKLIRDFEAWRTNNRHPLIPQVVLRTKSLSDLAAAGYPTRNEYLMTFEIITEFYAQPHEFERAQEFHKNQLVREFYRDITDALTDLEAKIWSEREMTTHELLDEIQKVKAMMEP